MSITLVLFIAALYAKGMTHDICLEAGVFLVSVKLIIMAFKISQATQETHRLLEDLRRDVENFAGSSREPDHAAERPIR